ncbi:MAG: hypothetical protein ACUVRK_08820 [Spirochaetota bacterium]
MLGKTIKAKTTAHIIATVIAKDNFNTKELIKQLYDYMALTPWYVQWLFTFSIIYLNLLSLVKKGVLFYKLQYASSESILSAMENSKLFFNRALIMMLKLLSTLVYFDNDEFAKHIGYYHLQHYK